ncbi:MAG: phage holin family protein [Propionibacteriales bacterium]|nr:phage holin family protein [Propionibacteriales bacterium]
MRGWLVRIVTNALALAAAAWLFDGIRVTGPDTRSRVFTLLAVSLIFGIVNQFVRPVIVFLSVPLYLLTLGLMYFVVNALMLVLTSWIAGLADVGFHVRGFGTAVLAGIVIAVASWLAGRLLRQGG